MGGIKNKFLGGGPFSPLFYPLPTPAAANTGQLTFLFLWIVNRLKSYTIYIINKRPWSKYVGPVLAIFVFNKTQRFLNTRTHGRMSAQKVLKSAQNFDYWMQNWQNRHYFLFFVRFDKAIFKFSFFMAILVHNSAQNYNIPNLDRIKEYTSRIFAKTMIIC